MNKKKIFNLQLSTSKSKGFTLIETSIYMAIFLIFILVLVEIFASIVEIRSESEATSAVTQDGRFILMRLSYDINRASAILIPANLGESSDMLKMTIDGDTYTYKLAGNNLQITNSLGTDNLNSSETVISNLSFRKIGNPAGKETVKIKFTVTSRAQRKKGAEIRTFQTTVGRR